MNHHIYTQKQKGELVPGQVHEIHFQLLMEISPVYSDKVILALRDFLVLGFTRKESCERHNVSPGYLSTTLGRIQNISKSVSKLMPYYI
ncbi:PapB/FocB family fimbrial expression transcriptional regulator [Escherichia coli]|uniref:PapB/FocB family fimbrial expression transcriptional regulator n=1 Tax=Escherichia coli TaxID=562 RepID=UPI0029883120|nr:transcriptional regulator [Escherichia coli]HAW3202025.1 transcriptional regulator [Escherichia coli]HAW6230370.1 transcriptional regulator [Escherichia coli]HDJ8924272.1 transcriptional regulator [Escherichia coli]